MNETHNLSMFYEFRSSLTVFRVLPYSLRMAKSNVKIIELDMGEAAGFVGISYQQLVRWLDLPFPPPRQHNKKFRSDDLGKWQRDKVAREMRLEIEKDPEALNAGREKARKDKEGADKLQLENQVRREELVDAAEIGSMWAMILMKVRTRILGIPSALAPSLAIEDDEATVQELLEDRCREALEELSQSWSDVEPDETGV